MGEQEEGLTQAGGNIPRLRVVVNQGLVHPRPTKHLAQIHHRLLGWNAAAAHPACKHRRRSVATIVEGGVAAEKKTLDTSLPVVSRRESVKSNGRAKAAPASHDHAPRARQENNSNGNGKAKSKSKAEEVIPFEDDEVLTKF